MTCPHLIRVRLLNALECPPQVLMLETTIAAYMFGRETARLGLEPLAELMGHPGQPKFAQRTLKASNEFQKRSGIQFRVHIPGARNVRRCQEFKSNLINDATVWISQQLSNDSRQLPTLVKIDEYAKEAISKFLFRPLAAIQQQPKKPTRSRGGSVTSWDTDVPIPSAAMAGIKLGFSVFPVDENKKPKVWNWQQRAATRSESLIRKWAKRWPDAGWAILCGGRLPDGGFLAVVDVDVHGGQFGNGFKTLGYREDDLGPLPETFTVKTGAGGGEHRYFRTSKPLPTSSRSLGPGLDCKALSGFVVAPGSIHASGERYEVICDLPIAWLPEVWENALSLTYETKRVVSQGDRHDYLCRMAYAMACNGKQLDEMIRTLRNRLQSNCEQGGRTIDDSELQALATSALAKISRSEMMLKAVVA